MWKTIVRGREGDEDGGKWEEGPGGNKMTWEGGEDG
jgi:hypothetical protein